MPELHLRQPWFTYNTSGPFTNHRERIKKIKETDYSNYIYKNELDTACFAHDAVYANIKDLPKRTVTIFWKRISKYVT